MTDQAHMLSDRPYGSIDDELHQVQSALKNASRRYRDKSEDLQRMVHAHHYTLLMLAQAAERREEPSGIHIVKVGYLAWTLAQKLGQSYEWVQQIRDAAPLHDIGKILVPEAVMRKAGALEDAERAVMKAHPTLGAEILGRARHPLFAMASEIALTHHERWDGGGYPRQISRQQIPLAGRVVAVVDFYDSLTSEQPYRPAYGEDIAAASLRSERGKAFDPEIVDVFLENFEEMNEVRRIVDKQEVGFAEFLMTSVDREPLPTPTIV